LDKSPPESVRPIAKILRIVYSTRLLHLQDFIGFRLFHLHWMPHLLTHHLREKRNEYAKTILSFLYVAERDGWHHCVTGDELWLFLDALPGYMWTLLRDDGVTKTRFNIKAKNSCLQSYGSRAASILLTDSQIISK
jgi:hypothetical protein